MKRAFVLTFLALLFTGAPTYAEKVATMPSPTGYVDDYASVLSAPAKSELEDLCKDVHTRTRAQIFFITVKTTEGEAVETFANELFAKWKIGERKTDRGVLILLAIKDHKRWIEIGYGFEGILNDAKVGDIGREMVPDLKAYRYDDAAKIGVREIARIIEQDPGVAPSTTEPPPPVNAAPSSSALMIQKGGFPWPLLIFFGVFSIPLFAFIFLVLRMQGRTIGTSGIGTAGTDTFSSSSDSSSSSSDSGGSDSLSGGDGGDSGGGGAGGDW